MKKIILALIILSLIGNSCSHKFDPAKPANPSRKFSS